MANIKVKDLTDTQTINTDDEIMVLTDENTNLVQNITVENFITNVISSDSDNVIEQGTDGKLFVETPENITGDLSNLTTTNKSTLVAAINEVDGDITTEATTRQNTDNNLQSQIDAITAASDVTDIVGTYAELQAYDTTGLPDNSIIKVLQDESRQDETTYYRWVITGGVGAWVLIGEEGPYYTKSQANNKFATQLTTGDLSDLDTTDKDSLVDAINEAYNLLQPTQQKDYIDNSKAMPSGEVSSNSLILPKIQNYAHSTFDRSKFTVVGSPNITDDGIASGFSGSNYVQTTNVDLSGIFHIKQKYTTDATLGAVQIIMSTATTNGFILSTNGIKIWLLATSDGSNFDIANIQSTLTLSTNTTYDIDFYFDGNKYYVDVNGTNYIEVTSNLTIYNAQSRVINIGFWSSNSNAYPKGSNDLKYFSITVDGVPVFSGNKTGIDTIKADDYTAVGTPTISVDGVLNQATYLNYVTTNTLTFSSDNDIDIEMKVYLLSGHCYVFGGNYGTRFEPFSIPSSAYAYSILSFAEQFALAVTEILPENQWITIRLHYRGANSYAEILENGSFRNLSTTVVANNSFSINEAFKIGAFESHSSECNIDLNAFKIYVDGNLVYQPCLKIPYTESSTGSKVANAIYRDRVKDAYEQGYLDYSYYTLDEDNGNFTLPMGEIYGDIENNRKNIAQNKTDIVTTQNSIQTTPVEYLYQGLFTVANNDSDFTTGTASINNGGFVKGTNSITVPVAGLYSILFDGQFTNSQTSGDYVAIYIGNTESYKVYSDVAGGNITGQYYTNLNAGDLIKLHGVRIKTETNGNISIRRLGNKV